MSSSEININGGKGINTPTAESGKNYAHNFSGIDFSKDAQGNTRIAHDNTLAFGDDHNAILLPPVAQDD